MARTSSSLRTTDRTAPRSRGNQKTTVLIDCKDLYLGLNAYVYAETKAK